MITPEARSIPDLLDNALLQASALVSNEIALARAEMSEKVAHVGRGAAMIAVGALLATPALVVILMAIASLLVDRGFAPWSANLLTGLVALALGALVIWAGASRFSTRELMPRATMDESRRDRVAVKEMVR